jgi:hypothetical protein
LILCRERGLHLRDDGRVFIYDLDLMLVDPMAATQEGP